MSSALAYRTLAPVLSFLPIEDTANQIQHQGLPGQQADERERCSILVPATGREGGSKCSSCSVVIAAAAV